MIRSIVVLTCLVALGASSLFAGGLGIGAQVPEFTVKSVEGGDVAYSSVAGDVTVVAYVSTSCPISNDYNERMKSIYGDYSAKGVKFVFINSNKAEDGAAVKAHAAENGFQFAVYKDPGNIVADVFGAEKTPEVYVVKAGKIVYHGRIDDARKGPIKSHSLSDALDAVLDGKSPVPAETNAFGCTIKKIS
jgi:peroxiredoxin